jgi:hypothetical protein
VCVCVCVYYRPELDRRGRSWPRAYSSEPWSPTLFHLRCTSSLSIASALTRCVLQRAELETLLAMERAARVAVEKAAATMSRSNAATPLQTPLPTAAVRGGGASRASCIAEAPSGLLEKPVYDVMGRHRSIVVSYASPDARCSPRRESAGASTDQFGVNVCLPSQESLASAEQSARVRESQSPRDC